MSERCPECGQLLESMDHVVDHLTDVHDAFSWVSNGRSLEGISR